MAQFFYFSTREADLTLKPAWVLHRRVPGQAGLLRKTLSRKQNKTKQKEFKTSLSYLPCFRPVDGRREW